MMTQPAPPHAPQAPPDPEAIFQNGVRGIESLPAILSLMQAQVSSVIAQLRDTSGELEAESVSTLRMTMQQLKKVSHATEQAAHGILDGIDRSLGMVDELEKMDGGANPAEAEKRERIKDELMSAINQVQFQDITSQQIKHAASLLTDMEDRFNSLVRALDPETINQLTAKLATNEQHFDPEATYGDRERRQGQADSVFQKG
ncbi:MAG: hypothetical protein NTZ43_15160 [Gemmatimonadetes bacterium]|nr:hypothetical protein [Gemmatimonadota bacterium]